MRGPPGLKADCVGVISPLDLSSQRGGRTRRDANRRSLFSGLHVSARPPSKGTAGRRRSRARRAARPRCAAAEIRPTSGSYSLSRPEARGPAEVARTTMNIQSAISKDVFVPSDERLLAAVEVRRRKRKRMSFLPGGAKGDYDTFICLSVTNTRPPQLLITKVKKFRGSSSFTRRTRRPVDQLRQVNGINPSKDSPEFDLVFDGAADQWTASSAAEKCIFVQILYRACQTYRQGKGGGPGRAELVGVATASPVDLPPRSGSLPTRRKSCVPPRQTEFVNCQAKLTRDASAVNLVIYRLKAFWTRLRSRMVAYRRASLAGGSQSTRRHPVSEALHRVPLLVGERGVGLSRVEDSTVELLHRAQRLADTAHQMALKHTK